MKTNSKTGMSAGGSKSKKSTKERDKQKTQTSNEKTDHNAVKGSPTKDANARKYAGICPDSILSYSEQSMFEHLSNDLCTGFAEDLSYKLRYVIHDALIKARLCGRNYILSNDLDITFDNKNIDRVLGATSAPNWIPFDKENLSYLDDPVINLLELAEEEITYTQIGNLKITRKWLPDNKNVGKSLKEYFETICMAVISNNVQMRLAALKDIRENTHIGPIIEWFYRFAYFLLSKDVTYDNLTLYVLNLIRSLEESSIAPQIVSEKMLKLLVRIILQRLLLNKTTIEVLKPMCNILAILSDRKPIKEFIYAKILKKIPDIKHNYPLALITLINELGANAIFELLNEEYLNYCLCKAKIDSDLVPALLYTYYITQDQLHSRIHQIFYSTFDRYIIPLWKYNPKRYKAEEQLETNWRNIISLLYKKRRKIPAYSSPVGKPTIEEMFPNRCTLKTKKLNIVLGQKEKLLALPESVAEQPPIEDYFNVNHPIKSEFQKANFITIGKFSLQYREDKHYLSSFGSVKPCCDHTISLLI